jgi:hypothetical protein
MTRNQIQRASIAVFFTTLSLLTSNQAQAAAGDLDSAFGQGGVVRTEFGGSDEYGFALKIQSDGKIIVAGQSGVYPVFHAALARYNITVDWTGVLAWAGKQPPHSTRAGMGCRRSLYSLMAKS